MFYLACENDLEGIVAKRKSDPYLLEHATWLKIRNQSYSRWVGRENCPSGSEARIPIWPAGMNASRLVRLPLELTKRTRPLHSPAAPIRPAPSLQ